MVLFEMLTGQPLFTGETVSDILAAVMRDDPDWSRLPASSPASLRRLLRRCLQKAPRERLHDIADARLELGDVLTRKRLLLTNKAHKRETLSIPLANVTALESTRSGIRIAYRDAGAVDQELWLGHIPPADGGEFVWMGDDSWVESVAAGIMEETGRDVWKEADPPWYRRDA